MKKEDQCLSGMDRRRFLAVTAVGAAALTASLSWPFSARADDGYALLPLPYAENALEPYISARTISFHYGKHHAGYVKKTNAAVAELGIKTMPLNELILFAAKDKKYQGLFNNAAQVANHTFYWKSMKPGGGGTPSGALLEAMKQSFGSFDQFKETLAKTAGGQFGSGWAWLVQKGDRLEVIATSNAETPLTMDLKPLLTVDVWEHAYYLDYQNSRGDYLKAFIDHLANWDFAGKNFES